MKAAILRRHGSSEVIEVADVGDPRPAAGEVLVDVKAAALNHLDIWVRRGGRSELPMPHIPGSDAAGVVAALGEGVPGLAVGDEVVLYPGLGCGQCERCLAGEISLCEQFGIIGLSRPGTFAQKVAVPAVNLRPKPPHLDFVHAAGLSLAYLTAWRMLIGRGQCAAGQSVLIHGIGGGVALAALQLAKFAGAEILATSSSDDKLSRAVQLGAHHAINYRSTPDVAAEVRRLTQGRGVDMAIDTVGGATFPIDLAALRKGGRVVLCGITAGDSAQADLKAIYWNQLVIMGSTLGSYEEFRQMLAAVSVNRLEPVIDSVYPLSEVRQATERMEAGTQFGKIVLRIAD